MKNSGTLPATQVQLLQLRYNYLTVSLRLSILSLSKSFSFLPGKVPGLLYYLSGGLLLKPCFSITALNLELNVLLRYLFKA